MAIDKDSYLQSKRLAFLLGAGISQQAGVPSTYEITCRMLLGENVIRATDATYYIQTPSNAVSTHEYLSRILPFLAMLQAQVARYYANWPGRQPNFEDLAYLANQIRDSELDEFDNPALLPLFDLLRRDLVSLLARRNNDKADWDIQKLADETANYIKDVEWRLLQQHQEKTDDQRLNYLKVFSDATRDTKWQGIDIFTVNHDTLLERHFNQQQLTFADGFGNQVGDVHFWEPHLFDDLTMRVRLYKLHGSIDWFELRMGNWLRPVRLIPTADCWHINAGQQQNIRAADGRPIMLVGTFDKMLRYTSDLHSELFCRFRTSLSDTERLIVCGYSFRDKGINSQIVEWLNTSNERRLIVVHDDEQKLRQNSRGAINNNWDNWRNSNRLVIIGSRIGQVSWNQIVCSIA